MMGPGERHEVERMWIALEALGVALRDHCCPQCAPDGVCPNRNWRGLGERLLAILHAD